jgi:hypothetical protein
LLSLRQRIAYAIELRRRARRQAKLSVLVASATDAVARSISGATPAPSEYFFYGSIGIHPGYLVTWYLFKTDAELEQARASGLVARIIAETRRQLADKGYPSEGVARMSVAFTTDEDIQRKTGGNRYYYFK